MKPRAEPLATLPQLGRTLDRDPGAIRRDMAGVAPSSQISVAGRLIDAWRLADLPAALRADLDALAARRGCRDAAALLAAPVAPWQPRTPVTRAAQAAIDKAVKLRAVLAPFLVKKDAPRRQADFEAEGVAAYQKAFGHPITGRWFRELFNRTVERDRHFADWQRLEIFLDDNAPVAAPVDKAAARQQFRHAELAERLAELENAAEPTADDREFLFDAAFRHFEALASETPAQRDAIKRSLLAWLFSAVPRLGATPSALKRAFNRKYAAWLAAERDPAALADNRSLTSGNFRAPVFAEDRNKIRDAAILHGGNVSLAHRKLRQAGQISPEFVNYYDFDPRRDKSYVPATVRAAVTPEVKMCAALHRGPWEARMRGPYIMRDWSDEQPGDWFSADDVTWNHNFWIIDEEGRPTIMRGECLLFIDLRSGYPLDFTLIAGKYNGENIRSAVLRVHDLHGLPHKGFYFEKGVWKSRLIVGERNRDHLPWRETERGLREHGLGMGAWLSRRRH